MKKCGQPKGAEITIIGFQRYRKIQQTAYLKANNISEEKNATKVVVCCIMSLLPQLCCHCSMITNKGGCTRQWLVHEEERLPKIIPSSFQEDCMHSAEILFKRCMVSFNVMFQCPRHSSELSQNFVNLGNS